MRILVALLALSPIIAAADELDLTGGQYLGAYQITSGSVIGGEDETVTGNDFSAGIYAAPTMLSAGDESTLSGNLGFTFGDGLPGPDDGVGVVSISDLDNAALSGMSQLTFNGFFVESGALVTQGVDITGAGTYTAAFDLSALVYYGAPGSAVANDYINVVGNGTVSMTVGPAQCTNYGEGLVCGSPQLESLTYTFAPELDPAWLSSALTLLVGGLMVLQGRRAHASANVRREILAS